MLGTLSRSMFTGRKTVNVLFDLIFSHLPCVFEDNDIPYVFVPSKHDLGAAIGSKRPTCVLLVKPGEDYMSDFGKAIKVRPLQADQK